MLNRTIEQLNCDWKIEGFKSEYGLKEAAYREDYIPQHFTETKVPATVQNALFNAGKIPDPYMDFNADKIRWIEEDEWWFFKNFNTPEYEAGQKVFIRFEGITYRAEVWVNGIQAGRIEGMFREDEFDVTEFLNADTNRLTLRIRTQENAAQDLHNSDLHDQIRAQGPVAQHMTSWNWCPHLVCVGIWRPVKLLVKSSLEIDQLRINTLAVDLHDKDGIEAPCGDAALRLECDIYNNSDMDKNVSIAYEIVGETFSGQVFAGEIRGCIPCGGKQQLFAEITVDQARLWWPNGLGKAELHRLKCRLRDVDNQDVEFREEIFGIRKYSFLHNEQEDWVKEASGHSMRPWSMIGEMYKWTFVVNGRKVFLKGSNWVILDSLLRLESDRYDPILSAAKAGDINFLRVWGGSLAETEEFYDLCDRYGIMCWQEFWLACGNYPAMNHDVFLRCVHDTVRRLINRASLIYYSGGNEYEPDNRENKVLVDKIEKLVAELNPEREFRRGSPYKGDKHGGLLMTPLVTRNKYLDILPNDRRIVLMRSEVATGRSTPLLSGLEKMIPKDKLWPMDEKIWKHFFAVPPEFKMFANEYDALDSFKHAVFANYLTHGWLCRYNMEYCRTQMFKCSGNLNWQLNAPWPCMHREIVEYNGVPKPAFYYHINACKPVIGVVDIERYLWHPDEVFAPELYIANDWRELKDARLSVKLYSTDSKLLHEVSFDTDVPENTALKLDGNPEFKIPRELAEKTILVRSELSVKGKRIHTNLYWIAVSNNPIAAASLSLCGEWNRDDGSKISLPGNDLAIKNDSFETVFCKNDGSGDLENAGSTACRTQLSDKQDVVYRKKIIMPDNLKNKALEFYSPGFEASDEVWINGVKIGSHDFRNPIFSQKDWAFVPFGKEETTSEIDPDSEYFFYSDPITYAKLESRFYDIPEKLLNQDGENEIVLIIKTYYQKAVSNIMEIRPKTLNREAVNKFFKEGRFFSDLRQMPSADVNISVDAKNHSLTVENISKQIAFGVTVELIPEISGLALALNDNLFTLFPGEKKTLSHLYDATQFQLPAKIRMYGWNIDEQLIKLYGTEQ